MTVRMHMILWQSIMQPMGDYENALNTQLKAIDFATFGSPYMKTAQLYYAKKNKKSINY